MIKIRPQNISDAERFYEILTNPNFIYFHVPLDSVEDERKYLAGNEKKMEDNIEWNYSIMSDDEVIGGIGVKVNQHRSHIGEIGYFLDEKFWGKGIATQAVKLVEDICFSQLKLTRLEILMQPENIGSEKVAIKNGYLKEGLLKKLHKEKDGTMKDCLLYAKVL